MNYWGFGPAGGWEPVGRAASGRARKGSRTPGGKAPDLKACLILSAECGSLRVR